MTTLIVQPATTERILSSIAFMPYWIYAGLRRAEVAVEFYEDVTLRTWDRVLDRADRPDIVVELSTYPQIDFALQAHQEGERGGHHVRFSGYLPLIKSLGLPAYEPPEQLVLSGVESYLDYLEEYEHGLRIDSDHHILAAARDRTVVPMFLSVGCKRACPYCYVSVSNYPYGVLDWKRTEYLLQMCVSNHWDVHFTDENFFRNPNAERIVEWLQGKDVRWICLTDTLSLARVIKEHGESWLLDSGNVCNEVGLETADAGALSTKAQDVDTLIASDVEVFWLTMTFLPDDSIGSMNRTGRFLKEHGHRRDQLVPYMAVSSTRGGLGQFMQLYHGTEYWDRRGELGKVYSDRGTRLWPSFIGHRVLRSVPEVVRSLEPTDEDWFGLYVGKAKVVETLARIDGRLTFEQIMDGGDLQTAVALAQLARLEVIHDKEAR